MVWYFFVVWAITYVSLILKNVFTTKEISKCINVLYAYINSANCYDFYTLNKHGDYQQKLNSLLEYYPVISKHTNFHSADLSYSNKDYENYRNAVSLYNDFLMLQNYSIHDLSASFNPLKSLKFIAAFPIMLINWFGFKPKESFSKFINVLGWIITYLLGMYSAEIKLIINSLFQKFIGT